MCFFFCLFVCLFVFFLGGGGGCSLWHSIHTNLKVLACHFIWCMSAAHLSILCWTNAASMSDRCCLLCHLLDIVAISQFTSGNFTVNSGLHWSCQQQSSRTCARGLFFSLSRAFPVVLPALRQTPSVTSVSVCPIESPCSPLPDAVPAPLTGGTWRPSPRRCMHGGPRYHSGNLFSVKKR